MVQSEILHFFECLLGLSTVLLKVIKMGMTLNKWLWPKNFRVHFAWITITTPPFLIANHPCIQSRDQLVRLWTFGAYACSGYQALLGGAQEPGDEVNIIAAMIMLSG